MSRIILKNFGPIEHFEFDLEKDFHLIIGENNVGKSYAITIIYLLIKSAMTASRHFDHTKSFYYFGRYHLINEDQNIIEEILKIDNLLKAESQEIDITKEIKELFIKQISVTWLKILENSICSTFDSIESLSNRFNDKKFIIKIKSKNISIDLTSNQEHLVVSFVDLHKKVYIKNAKQNRKTREDEKKTTFYYNGKNLEILNYNIFQFVGELYSQLFEDILDKIVDIHYLPASRSGLYQALSAFGQIIAELSKSRSFLTKKVELPAISEPLSDYFLKLSEIVVKKRAFEDKPLNQIAMKIEKEILHGEVEFDVKTKRIMFAPYNTDLKLDLSSTSSMVSELSPIVSYLRYVLISPTQRRTNYSSKRKYEKGKLPPKHIVIIEEPEAHLHPEIQIKITEIFSSLSMNNVKVIITTHSNFIFNKVNNLVLSKQLDIDKIQAILFKNAAHGSMATHLNIDELGIDDENFVNASELLYEEKINIIEMENKND